MWGTGKPLREYTYSEDIAKIFIWALDNFDSEKPINIGSPEELSIKEIIYLVCKKIGLEEKKIVLIKINLMEFSKRHHPIKSLNLYLISIICLWRKVLIKQLNGFKG